MSQKSLSRWQQLSLWDIACLFYWFSFFTTFCIVFDWPIDFRDYFSLYTPPRKFVMVFGFWAISIIFVQCIFGIKGSFKVMKKIMTSPLAATWVFSGFMLDSRKLLIKIKNRLPMRQIFWVALVCTLVVALTETNKMILSWVLPVAWVMLIWVIYLCFKWALNPIPFLNKLSNDAIEKARSPMMSALTKIEVTEPEAIIGHERLLKHLNWLKSLIVVIPKILNFVRGPKLLFATFVAIFLFGALNSILLVVSILRINNELTPGGAFAGSFFNNQLSDYFYIAISQFSSSEAFNISVTSPNVRFALAFLPMTSMVLGLLLVLAFTMVAQNNMDTTFKNFGDSTLKIIEDATQQISSKREVVLIDARKEKVSSDSKPIAEKISTTKPDAPAQ